MPLPGTILRLNETGAKIGELHIQLARLGAVIDSAEQSETKFGSSTAAAVSAFRKEHGLLDDSGNTLDLSAGRVMHVASAFAGGRAALRAALREAAPTADANQPQEIYWLTRYAIIAGDYQTANDLATKAPDHLGIREFLGPIIGLDRPDIGPLTDQGPDLPPVAPPPQPPEIPHPENFYTYRHDFYPLDLLSGMQGKLRALGESFIAHREVESFSPPYTKNLGKARIEWAATWIEAIKQWQIGNDALNHRRYSAAVAAYDACQSAVCAFFHQDFFGGLDLSSGTLTERLTKLIEYLWNKKEQYKFMWSHMIGRRERLSLQELRAWDFPEPGDLSGLLRPRAQQPDVAEELQLPESYELGFVQFYWGRLLLPPGSAEPSERQIFIEAALITIAFVLAPLARAEANRSCRQYEAAFRDLRWVIDSVVVKKDPEGLPLEWARLACEFIELPFARLLIAETLLDKADAEHKARIEAEKSSEPNVTGFQNLKAAQTYLAVIDTFRDEGEYVARANTSQEQLTEKIKQYIAANDTHSQEFRLLGKDVLVPTLTSSSSTLPGLDRRAKAHEPLLSIPAGIRESNPRVYAILLTAISRLEQMKAGFNYLGYLDSYVPPWRFQFLLERARYFAEHAKNAQREYLNFLSNAEREEFQELSASQNVEMEKSNVRIETARVDQATAEVAVAHQSQALAELTKRNAQARLRKYKEFDNYADGLFGTFGGYEPVEDVSGKFGMVPGGHYVEEFGAWLGDRFSGGAVSNRKQALLADQQRELEKFNLGLAVEEAKRSAFVAAAQVEAAQASLVVAGLQRQAAVLRHEFALQNLQFLRNRNLSAEQWYRLATAIRSVSETYLKYALELAFLAEQAYEFEADKRINIIRFDYDLSEVGDFLAADFLLRDLDTLEKDLIVTQRQRQQHVRYVLSMAREFPEALQSIREDGIAEFSLRLEQLEKRFPGLYNLRIGVVDVLPIALMDSTRFSLELTYLGTSQVRLKAQPDTPIGVPSPSPLNENDLIPFLFSSPATVFADELDQGAFSNEFRQKFPEAIDIPTNLAITQVNPGLIWRLSWQVSPDIENKILVEKKDDRLFVYSIDVDDDWLHNIRDQWPVKIRVMGSETAVFSSLPRDVANVVFAFATNGQRQAFESLGAAATWKVDFTARDNQVVPGTLADLIITFTLSGYHDPELRSAIDDFKSPRKSATTNWLSARTTLPDAFYELNRSGKMTWKVTRNLLTLTDTLDKVRNVAFLLLPQAGESNYFGRLMSHCQVQIRINDSGDLEDPPTIPQVIFTSGGVDSPLSLTVQANADGEISWNFGDDTAWQSGSPQQHDYAKPGKYMVTLRVVQDGHLSEFRADVVVSRSYSEHLMPPVTAFPTLRVIPGADAGYTRIEGAVNTPATDPVIADWRVAKLPRQKGNQVTFDLAPGDYTVVFTAIRPLKACVYCKQRYFPNAGFEFNGLSLSSNRRFEGDGTEITGVDGNPAATPFTDHLFSLDPTNNERLAISPVDEWIVEFPLTDNPCLRIVSATDMEQHDLSEIQDAVLVLEYETRPGRSYS